MNEQKIGHDIIMMIKKEFKDYITITRHHCGRAKGFSGAFIFLGDPFWPDFIGFTENGRFIGIETKAPKSKTQKERKEGQDSMLAKIEKAGGYAIKTDSVEDCRQKLLKIVLEIKKH